MSKHNDEQHPLTITIPTADSKILRIKLMKGLTRSMRNYIIAEDDRKEQIALVQLLETLIPDEPDMEPSRAN